ncbi:hypothetical protein INS49_009447 [Diaporthe citri]|uniref:uncharacterized protein n=1 Tax=Diaporthe citri TaxID=83186 RepID=UPI001C813A12|nr:uncharacterized protein INS49_009447 [Diaporthe citri]KAG6361223.1 hypothetical protein INS49_009447 [Diaporthe citri]
MISILKSWFMQDDSTPETCMEKSSIPSEKKPNSPQYLPKRPPKDLLSVYEECKLAPRDFRVFLMDPSESPDSPIVGHLCKLPLNSAGSFEALSYRWEGSFKNTIDVNGAELAVTENLFLALKALRAESGGLPTPLWVDSICINQMDVVERSQQVPLMGQIYSKASPVRVWLGEECSDVKEAFKLVHDCGECSPADAVARVLQDEAGARALNEILHRSYWDRMWMFQEIVLAGRVTVHCGSYEVPWTYFKWLQELSGYAELWSDAQIGRGWILDLRKALLRISLFAIPREEAQDINAVIIQTRHLHCQDPRDKLYALIGVCKALSRKLKVDYLAPARDVYTSFAKGEIEAGGELYTILTAGLYNPGDGDDLDLPSWVPDLRGTTTVDTRYIGGAYLELFNADNNNGNDPFFVFFEESGRNILQVEALLLETTMEALPFEINEEAKRSNLLSTFCLIDGGDFSVPKLRQFFQVAVSENSAFYGHKVDSDGTLKERMERLILGFFGDLRRLHGSHPAFDEFLRSFNIHGLDMIPLQSQSLSPDSACNDLHRNELEYLQRTLLHGDSRDSTMFNTSSGI